MHSNHPSTREPVHSAGLAVVVPFFLRKAWTAAFPRSGAAPSVPFNQDAACSGRSVTWIGHSTLLVHFDRATFLTDPIFSPRASPLPFGGPRRLVAPPCTLDALPRIDFVTLSHDHYDHADLTSIAFLADRGVPFVVPHGLGGLVRSVHGEVRELNWWEHTCLGSLRVHCVPAQHFSGRALTDHGQRMWCGWVVEGSGRFYHAGDTGAFPGFREIARRLGPVDLAALPIGAYEPAEMMQGVHLNPEEAVRAAMDLAARRVVAMHWGTFDLTDEPLDEPPRRFRAAATAAGIGKRAFVPSIGETLSW